MPPKMVKNGQPKEGEITLIGLPCWKKTKFANKTQKVVTPFSKLRPTEKDRLVLQSRQLYDSFKLVERDDTTKDVFCLSFFHLSDVVKDEENFDIERIEKYCHKSA